MKNKSEKDRISAVLFIIVFLLVVVIVIMVLKTLDKKDDPQTEDPTIATQNYQPPVVLPDNNVQVVDPNATPNPYEPVSVLPGSNQGSSGGQTSGGGQGTATGTTPTQQQVPAPAPTTAPATTPAPAPAPTQAPAATEAPAAPFVPVALNSGSFESDTNTGLNIRAEWSAKTVNDTQVEVTVTVFCLHQTLHTGAYNPVNIMVDGQYATAEAKKIDSDSYDAQKTEIASRTFTIDLSQGSSKTFWVNVEWEYGGTYSGVRLDSIECGGNVTLTR